MSIDTIKHTFIFRFIVSFLALTAVCWLWHLFIEPDYSLYSLSCLSFLIASSLLITLLHVYFNKTLISSERERRILSEAFNLQTNFWFVTNRNGRIVYSNNSFQALFPDVTKFIHLLDQSNITVADKEKFIHAFYAHDNTSIPFSLDKHSDMQSHKLHLTHMKSPSGYSLFYVPHNDLSSDHKANLDQLITANYIISDKDNILYMNDACLALLGYTSLEDIPQSDGFSSLLSSKNPPSLLEDFMEAEQWKGVISINTVKEKHKELYVEQYIDSQTKFKHGIITPAVTSKQISLSSDITKNAWNIYLKDSPTASATINKDGTLIQYNIAFDQLTDLKEPKTGSLSIFDIVSPEQKDELAAYFKKLSNTKETDKPFDATFRPRNEKSAHLHITPLPKSKKNSAKSPSYICHLIDITEQKSLEERFAHSQRMQAIGQLAGGIAHDFNNLLTAIIGFCDLLLLRHPAGDRSFSDIMQIKQNSTRAANLVRQLLAFSRKQTLQPEIISITDALSEISHLIRRLIGENIDLVMNHGRDVGKTKVDQGQFEQVIINLAVNARDAMSETGMLTIQTENIQVTNDTTLDKDLIAPDGANKIVPGEYIRIEIIDTGCGIPRNKIDKIFEPFFTTKEIGSGTGLGLSTVYGIVNQTEGYIFVTSKHNKGTTFTIFLKHHVDVDDTRKIEEDSGDSTDLTGKETILLVEDEDPVRAFSTQALGNKGYKVLDADNGTTALEVAKEHIDEIDLIITDVMMPGMNGPTMIKEIQKMKPDIKVIFISGYAEDAFITSYGSDRNFHFLPKPFTLKQLALKVKETLSENKK